MQTFAWPLLMAGILDVSCYDASQIQVRTRPSLSANS